ncbi:type ISP restriction/modification enzyme [Streptomyces sp. NBC_00306]|uniref:type ISP restriction/modification enzyme n=1 Tax=Streptomyces sp. NBC_00306 TaxID=2975708 RepID=UPI002E2B3A93|nr:type ISP restriction/modification enzyme [Streptomyces sp. NBC_00306]
MPMLDALMPWGVRPLRPGRSWVIAPDAGSLTARWDAVVRAEGPAQDALFGCTRARTPRTAVGQLPGQAAGTGRFIREDGRCPEPVRIAHGAFDEQWLIPDHRLLDVARPELWRVADDRQIFAVEQGWTGDASGPAVLMSALLPDGYSPAGRPGRIRPLYRRPGGDEPNLAPGLLPLLESHYGRTVAPEDVLAWIAAAAEPSPAGCLVPLPADPEVWLTGVDLGRTLLDIQLRGARGGAKPRLPGGRRPYVRAAVPARPDAIAYDAEEEVLSVGEGRISPVPPAAWDVNVGGTRVLEAWFARRTTQPEPGTLEAIRPGAWPQEWTSELLELITVLALFGELTDRRAELKTGAEITDVGVVLPPPDTARRPASVLDHHEEGPEGQFALL